MSMALSKGSIAASALALLVACSAQLDDRTAVELPRAQVAQTASNAPATSDAGTPAAPDPERAALLALADSFLTAMQQKSAARLLGPGAVVTENGSKIAIDASQIAGARSYPYRAVFAEPSAGAIGMHAVADVGASPLVFSARLKLDGMLSEVELVTVRPGEASVAAPERLTAPHPMYEGILDHADRSSRSVLIAAANAYFDGIEAADGAKVPFAEGCNRFENGVQTTNAVGGPSPLLAQTCGGGLRYLEYIETIRDRRFPVVDEERGLVWSLAVFDIPGGTYRQEFPDGTVTERVQPPRSILIAEMFKVVKGLIVRIEVVMRNAPLGALSGW